jgi:hypothetical protein
MPFRDYILHNFWWKLLSLLLAAMTWLFIETTFQREESLRQIPVVTSSTRNFPAVPVTLLTSAANPSRYQVDPISVSVEIGGTAEALAKLQAREIRAFVDISSSAGDEKQFRKKIQVQLPPDLKVEKLDHSMANLERETNSQ